MSFCSQGGVHLGGSASGGSASRGGGLHPGEGICIQGRGVCIQGKRGLHPGDGGLHPGDGGLHPGKGVCIQGRGVCIQGGLHGGADLLHWILRDTVNERVVRILLEYILVTCVIAVYNQLIYLLMRNISQLMPQGCPYPTKKAK